MVRMLKRLIGRIRARRKLKKQVRNLMRLMWSREDMQRHRRVVL